MAHGVLEDLFRPQSCVKLIISSSEKNALSYVQKCAIILVLANQVLPINLVQVNHGFRVWTCLQMSILCHIVHVILY